MFRAAELGSVEAQRDLPVCFAVGSSLLPQDWAQARDWYKRAADNGNQDAQVTVGSMMIQGDGGPVEVDEGVRFLESVARGGDADCAGSAASQLWRYYSGHSDLLADPDKAAGWEAKTCWWKAQGHQTWSEFAEAVSELEKFQKLTGEPREKEIVHAMLGSVYLGWDKPEQAIPHFRRFLAKSPRSLKASETLYLSLTAMQDYEAALEEGLRFFQLRESEEGLSAYKLEDYRCYKDLVAQLEYRLRGTGEAPGLWRCMAVLPVMRGLGEPFSRRCLKDLGSSPEESRRSDDGQIVEFEVQGYRFLLCCRPVTAYLSSPLPWRVFFEGGELKAVFLRALESCERLLEQSGDSVVLSSLWQPTNWVEVDGLGMTSILEDLEDDGGVQGCWDDPGGYNEKSFFLKPAD